MESIGPFVERKPHPRIRRFGAGRKSQPKEILAPIGVGGKELAADDFAVQHRRRAGQGHARRGGAGEWGGGLPRGGASGATAKPALSGLAPDTQSLPTAAKPAGWAALAIAAGTFVGYLSASPAVR